MARLQNADGERLRIPLWSRSIINGGNSWSLVKIAQFEVNLPIPATCLALLDTE